MTDKFNRQVIKVSVAQTCQAVGWTSIQTTPLELLTDLVQSYIKRLSRLSSSYANFYGQSEPNLDHVALAFKDMGINVNDLQDYVTYVDNNNVLELPMYPLPKESHLNLLKPGSREVVTRPVHIHEHLPPMHPHLEEPEYPMKASPTSNENSTADVPGNARGVFKRPLDVSQETASRRIRLLQDEEVRPLREISSVMMTTSGFLSHAREGKLPESRSIPPIEEDTDDSPLEEPPAEREKNTAPAPPSNTETKAEKKKKTKSGEGGKKVDKENKNKDEANDSLGREDEMHKVKKLTGMKETNKLKALKTGAVKLHSSGPNDKKNEKKKKRIASPGANPVGRPRKSPKVEKPRSPVYREMISASDDHSSASDIKISSEPDKQKLNIFKKITKIKEEHDEIKTEVTNDGGPKHSHVNDTVDSVQHSKVVETIKKHDTDDDSPIFGGRHSPLSTDDLAFIDDPSRPGTPATPKTPDLPRVTEHKKKKKDKHREKKEQEKYISSPRSSKSDEFPSKPKTPEVDITGGDDAMTPPFHFYPNVTFPSGPGLIPPPFSHPLIPHMPLMGPYPRMPTPPFTSKLIPTPTKEKEPPQILNIGPGGIQIPNGITLTPVPPPMTPSQEPGSAASSKLSPLKKKDKKDKKNKDKTKKKKDKKEKYKTKDKSEKKKVKLGKKEKDKLKSKKEKKEKKKEKEATEGKKDVSSPALPKITLKLGPASPQDPVTENVHRKIVIKPLIKKEEDMDHFAKITAPESSKSSKKTHHSKKADPQPDIFKSYGSHSVSHSASQNFVQSMTYDLGDIKFEQDKVWICPACVRPDDGSPMIACDLCDNWFHWICVGIQEAIDGDWYCRECRIKKEEEAANEKKKKHKKKKIKV